MVWWVGFKILLVQDWFLPFKINSFYVVLDRVWISSGSSISGFKIPNFSSLSFSSLWKLAQNSSSFQVYRFERKFWPKFGQNASFFGKISYSRELDLIKSQFSGFFMFGFWQSLEIRFFFEFEFGKIAKTRRVFELG